MNISPLRLLVNRTIRTLCPALLLLPVACSESGLTIRVIDPLTNVLPGIVCPPAGDDTVRVARGENAVLQFVISADDSVGFVDKNDREVGIFGAFCQFVILFDQRGVYR